jgi:phosphatidylglycerol:prolipoprotein diacylglycerol transferase
MEHFIWNISPTIFSFGPLELRWYGLLFVGSFFIGLSIMQWIFKREGHPTELLDTLLLYILAGTIIGARLAHCLAYEPTYYLAHPLEILQVWKGGLASHGGTIGVLLAIWIFTKRYSINFWWLLSRIALPTALVATAIRIGNFFNSEILGKPTEVWWAVIFEHVDNLPRHPVQLYEAFSYLLFFGILLWLYRRLSPTLVTRLFTGLLFFYIFTVRFFLEYTKTKQAAYTLDLPLNTGQLLSIPFMVIGLLWIIWAFKGYKEGINK